MNTSEALSSEPQFPTIRPARISDLPVLVDLLCQLFTIETDFVVDPSRHARGLRLLMRHAQRGTAAVLVAQVGDEVVGMATAQTVISTAEGARSGWIEDVVVRDGWRRSGVGGLLMEEVRSWARRAGVTRLQLLADHRNRPALDFYEHRGFGRTNMVCLRLASPTARG
jgi:ribosomal protein S18 acetylase RimI-like enzyme